MSEKEKLEKENEQFSSAILYVATAVYVGVCAMVFGALYAKLPSFGDAFLLYMKDYGTILAGIPVLVAVVVAKQQLDANRRQHVATVKRSLKGEIEVIDMLVHYLSQIIDTTLAENENDNSDEDVPRISFWQMDHRDIAKVDAVFPSNFSRCVEQTNQLLKDLETQYAIHGHQIVPKMEQSFSAIQEICREFLVFVEDEKRTIEEYWS
nr:hypothetical protein [Brucella intermedia]